ncbi:hypothetical protein Goklo_001245, partial [Gossypium klotzschianum]|nr:hypothetical protein [Gossypium klotzschianum]
RQRQREGHVVDVVVNEVSTLNTALENEVIRWRNKGMSSNAPFIEERKGVVFLESSDIDKRIDALSKTPLNLQGLSSLPSSSVVALPLMTMVTPKAMLRTGTENIVQPDVNNMDPMQRQQWIMDLVCNNNNNPQTHVGGDEMMFQFGDNIKINNGLWSNVVFPSEK